MSSSTGNVERVDRTTELRHVSNKFLGQLSNILNSLDSWKELMAAIPKRQISATEFDESTTQTKYKHSEIKDIEVASRATRQPTLILFNEWGTSGHVRPTLAHLMILLVRLELYRAADFVAIEMLREPVPVRPVVGPAARVDITFLDKANRTTLSPSVALNTIENQIQPDKIGPSVVQKVDPEPVPASAVPNFESNRNLDGPIIKTEPPAGNADHSISIAIPNLSALNEHTPLMSKNNIPQHIGLSGLKSDAIPDRSAFMGSIATQSEMNIPQHIGLSTPETAAIPNLSALVPSPNDLNGTQSIAQSVVIPKITALLESNPTQSETNIPLHIGLNGESVPSALLPVMLNADSLSQAVAASQPASTTSNIPRYLGLGGKSDGSVVLSEVQNSITDAGPTSTKSNIPFNIGPSGNSGYSEDNNNSDASSDDNIPLVSALG